MTLSGMTPAGMRLARNVAGLSLETVANRMGVPADYLRHMEIGHRQITKKDNTAFWCALAGNGPDPSAPLREELREAYRLIAKLRWAYGGSLQAGGLREYELWMKKNAAFGPGGEG